MSIFDYFLTFDVSISLAIYQLRTPLMSESMKLISFLGNEAILGFSILLFVFLLHKNLKKEFLFSFFVLSGGMVLNLIAKFVINRPRPTFSPLVEETFKSFPSGHAMNSLIFYSLVLYYLYRFHDNKNRNKILTVLITLLVLAIGFSRVYLGVHYPTDVIGGYILGFGWLMISLKAKKNTERDQRIKF